MSFIFRHYDAKFAPATDWDTSLDRLIPNKPERYLRFGADEQRLVPLYASFPLSAQFTTYEWFGTAVRRAERIHWFGNQTAGLWGENRLVWKPEWSGIWLYKFRGYIQNQPTIDVCSKPTPGNSQAFAFWKKDHAKDVHLLSYARYSIGPFALIKNGLWSWWLNTKPL